MPHYYHHTQIGYLTIFMFAVFFTFMASLMAIYGFNWVGLAVIIFMVLILVLFVTLTVRINADKMEIHFGPGIIRKKFHLKEIESCRVVKNPWYCGWGIRRTPHGWLYNVSGFDAVEITLNNGKKYRIGTDVPNELEQAIRQTLEKR
ncbi:MAG: hypothetical protein ONB32_09735 [candidate division KSB1 bacterium]|nr:hypothetical protein [candidate division KSB1 bacterium]